MSVLRAKSLSGRETGPVARPGFGAIISESGELGAEIFRHAMLIIGVVGLVAIASGALLDSAAYWSVLNWVSSWFCRG